MPPKTPPRKSPPEPETPRGRIPRAVLAALVVVIVLGAGLRFYGLEVQSLWLDELWTVAMSDHESLHDMFTIGRLPGDVHPPGYFLMHYYLQKCFGTSPTVLRLPAAIAGALCVPLIYRLGRRLYSRTEGLIAAGLMAVLWAPIYYSQEARANSALLLFSLLTVSLWIPLVWDLAGGKRPGWIVPIGYSASALVLSMVHYFGLCFVGMQAAAAIVILIRRRRVGVALLPVIYLPIFVAYAFWLMVLFDRNRPAIFSRASLSLDELFRWLNWAFVPALTWGRWIVLALLAWVAGRAVWDARLRRVARHEGRELPPASDAPATPYAGWILAAWLVVPFAAAWVTARFGHNYYFDRSMIFCLPAVYLLVARAFARMPVPRVALAAAVATLAVALLFRLVVTDDYYRRPAKAQWREAAAWVAQNDWRYTNSVIVGWKMDFFFYDYYLKRFPWKQGPTRGMNFRLMEARPQGMEQLDSIVRERGFRHIWLLRAHWDFEVLKGETDAWVPRGMKRYTLVDRKEFLGAEVFLYRTTAP